MEGYRTPQVAAITGVNPKTLHYWDHTGFLSPGIARSQGTGTRRIYSFPDLVALRVVRELREAGISLQSLRQVVAFLLRQKELARHPLAQTYLVTDGRDVYARTGKNLVSALRQPGQGLLFHVVDLSRTIDEIHRAAVPFQRPPDRSPASASVQPG